MFYGYLLIALCVCVFYTLSFIHAVFVFISDEIFIICYVLIIAKVIGKSYQLYLFDTYRCEQISVLQAFTKQDDELTACIQALTLPHQAEYDIQF